MAKEHDCDYKRKYDALDTLVRERAIPIMREGSAVSQEVAHLLQRIANSNGEVGKLNG